jgi:predicted aspartyl protease
MLAKAKSLATSALICAALAVPAAIAADTPFQQAVKAFNAKNYRDAYTGFAQCLKQSPNDVNALYYEALCCYQLGDVQGSRLRYQRIVSIAPTSSAAERARAALSSLPAATTAAASSSHSADDPDASDAKVIVVSGSGQLSPEALASLVKQAKAQAIASSSSGNGADGLSSSEYAALPERAKFYFTRESSGHMAVTASVNNHQLPAWFDTGASGTLFYRDQLQAAGVDLRHAVSAGYTHGWAGRAVPIYSMDAEVKLGDLTRHIKIIFQDADSGLSRNLIGQTFIQGYQYEIDDKGGRVELRKSIEKDAQQIDPMYDIPLRVVNAKDIIQIEVNGRKVETFIDTGASVSIINQASASQCGIESTGTQILSGVGGSLAVGVGSAKIRLGPIYKDFTIRIGGAAGNCIGQDFMEGWRFKIDRERGLLRFFH